MTIDIIVPCYYSSDVIRPCFQSIISQTVIKDIRIIMVNDCSPNTDCEYQDIINEFNQYCNILYLKTSTNSGPGIARQLGLNNATADWVRFIDDDDRLYDTTSIEKLINLIKPGVIAISGQSLHQSEAQSSVHNAWPHPHNTLYNRKFLSEQQIQFDPRLSFREEDGTFAQMVMAYSTPEQRQTLNDIVYIKNWNHAHVSVTQAYASVEFILYSLLIARILQLSYNYNANKLSQRRLEEDVMVITNILYTFAYSEKYSLKYEHYQKILEIIPIFNDILKNKHYHIQKLQCQEFVDFYNKDYVTQFLTFQLLPVMTYMDNFKYWMIKILQKVHYD